MPSRPASDSTPRQARLRDRPQQRRARQRLDAILTAAETLIETQDIETISTNLIAHQAQVPVSSVYRYFKNVSAVFAYLFEDLNEEIASVIEDNLETSEPGWDDWPEVTGLIIARVHQFFCDNPGYRRLLLVTHTSQELRTAKDEMITHVSGLLAGRWAQGYDGFSGGDPQLVARFITELCLSMEARCAQIECQSQLDALFGEMLTAVQVYLAQYLNKIPPAPDGGPAHQSD